jgi:hypothetical protein
VDLCRELLFTAFVEPEPTQLYNGERQTKENAMPQIMNRVSSRSIFSSLDEQSTAISKRCMSFNGLSMREQVKNTRIVDDFTKYCNF